MPGAAVAVVTTRDGKEEARWVAQRIKELLGRPAWGEGGSSSSAPLQPHDIAVLYRVNRQVSTPCPAAAAGPLTPGGLLNPLNP